MSVISFSAILFLNVKELTKFTNDIAPVKVAHLYVIINSSHVFLEFSSSSSWHSMYHVYDSYDK